MEKVRTVVFLNHTAALGGAEFALKRLVCSMNRRAWCPVLVFGEDGPAVDLMRGISAETYVLPLGKSLASTRRESLSTGGMLAFSRLRSSVGYTVRLGRFLRERAADLVHTNSMKAHVLGGFAAKQRGLPVVWHLRDTIAEPALPKAAVRYFRFLASRVPDALISVSASVGLSALGNVDEDRFTVIYDGLEADAFELTPVPKEDSSVWRVGIAGRLTPWKGRHVFLEAAAQLCAKGYPIHFEVLGGALFGEKSYADGLMKQAQVLGLDGRVSFRGMVSDVSKRMRGWDVCVHASTAPDPCPNVVLEAMAVGIPLVATAGGGVPELLENGDCGELVPMGDSTKMAMAIERLLLNRTHRETLSKRARERALVHFRCDRVAREVEGVWTRVLKNRDSTGHKWPWIEQGLSATKERTREEILR